MKKILFVVVGLVMSAGLYAQQCYPLKNHSVTNNGRIYVLNGKVCLAQGAAVTTLEQYILSHDDGIYRGFSGVSLTINKQTILSTGNMKVERVESVLSEGQMTCPYNYYHFLS